MKKVTSATSISNLATEHNDIMGSSRINAYSALKWLWQISLSWCLISVANDAISMCHTYFREVPSKQIRRRYWFWPTQMVLLVYLIDNQRKAATDRTYMLHFEACMGHKPWHFLSQKVLSHILLDKSHKQVCMVTRVCLKRQMSKLKKFNDMIRITTLLQGFTCKCMWKYILTSVSFVLIWF